MRLGKYIYMLYTYALCICEMQVQRTQYKTYNANDQCDVKVEDCYETGKKQLRMFARFGWIRPESPRYCAKFTTMCYDLFGNTAIRKRINHELVKNTLNAARIGHELTEICDDSRRFARFVLTTVLKETSMLLGASVPK